MIPEELERRVQALEDLEAIKGLKARYAQVCDDHYNPEEMVKLFTEDAEFVLIREQGTREQYKGRDAIRGFFEGTAKRITFSVHYFIQPYIEINGSRAKGLWYMWCPATMADDQCVWLSGIEEDKYEKANGKWLIAESKVTIFFRAPYGKGWQ